MIYGHFVTLSFVTSTDVVFYNTRAFMPTLTCGGVINTVDLVLIFKILWYDLALVGVTTEKGSYWLPKATIELDSRGA